MSSSTAKPATSRSKSPPRAGETPKKKSAKSRLGTAVEESNSSTSTKYSRDGQPIPDFYKEPAMTYGEMRKELHNEKFKVTCLARKNSRQEEEIKELKKKLAEKEANDSFNNAMPFPNDNPMTNLETKAKDKLIRRYEYELDEKDQKIADLRTDRDKYKSKYRTAESQIKDLNEKNADLTLSSSLGRGSNYDKAKDKMVEKLEEELKKSRDEADKNKQFKSDYFKVKQDNEKIFQENYDLKTQLKRKGSKQKELQVEFFTPNYVHKIDKEAKQFKYEARAYRTDLQCMRERVWYEEMKGNAKVEDVLDFVGADEKRRYENMQEAIGRKRRRTDE